MVEPGGGHPAGPRKGRLGEALGATSEVLAAPMRKATGFPCGTQPALLRQDLGERPMLEASPSGPAGSSPSPRASGPGPVSPCPRAPRDRQTRSRIWRCPATGPAVRALRAESPRGRASGTPPTADHVEAALSQAPPGSSPCCRPQPPAGRALEERAQEQQPPPRTHKPPGRGERQPPTWCDHRRRDHQLRRPRARARRSHRPRGVSGGLLRSGLVSDEPDPVVFLGSSSSQQRAATRVESPADPGPATEGARRGLRSRTVGARAGAHRDPGHAT